MRRMRGGMARSRPDEAGGGTGAVTFGRPPEGSRATGSVRPEDGHAGAGNRGTGGDPGEPATPPLARRLWRSGRDTTMRMLDDSGLEIAGYMSFMALLALFPFLIFLTALAGSFGRAEEAGEGIDRLLGTLPPDIASALAPVVDEVVTGATGGLMTFGVVATLWTASSGVEALRGALNRAYGVTVLRPIWVRRIQSIAVVVTFGVVIVVLSVMYVLGPVVWDAAQTWFPGLRPDEGLLLNGAAIRDLPLVVTISGLLSSWLSAAMTAALVFVLVLLLHWILPSAGTRSLRLWPGALFTAVCWVIASGLFSFYLRNIANMNITYGSLGAVVAAMLYFYMTSLIFLVGGYMNAAITELFPKGPPAARPPARRPPARPPHGWGPGDGEAGGPGSR